MTILMVVHHRPLRNLESPRTHHHRPIPRDFPRNAENPRRRHRNELPTPLKRHQWPLAARNEMSFPRSLAPLLLRLRGLRSLVLPETQIPLVSNRVAEQRRTLSMGPK